MGRPQQPELARSAKTDLDPDHVGSELEARKPVRSSGGVGPVPPENQPGHHPDEEQDKPDLEAFAAKLSGAEPPAGAAGKTAKTARTAKRAAASKQAAKETAAPKPAAGRKAAGTRPAQRPAPAKATDEGRRAATTTTPGKQPAAAPNWSEAGRRPDEERTAPAGVGNGDGAEGAEPPFVGLALLPLRITVRSLERLERQLTERWRRRSP